jgi:hypothetical protein
MYAKSNFYEVPDVRAAKCTHKSSENSDPARVQLCKDSAADEDTCLTNGNYYTDSVDNKKCGGTAARVTSTIDVTGAEDRDAGRTLCQTGCTNAKADCDFYEYATAGDAATMSGHTCKLY